MDSAIAFDADHYREGIFNVWLAYRLQVPDKSRPVSWKAVIVQFGTGTNLRYFKPEFRMALGR